MRRSIGVLIISLLATFSFGWSLVAAQTATPLLPTIKIVALADGASLPVTFAVTVADLAAHDASLATTPAGMNMAMGTPTVTATTTAPLAPTSDGGPDFGLWLLAIVGLGAIFVLGQSLFRGRAPSSNPTAAASPPAENVADKR